MIDTAGLNFTALPDEDYDSPLGIDTGAGLIFGATGGVMEAALRTAADWLTGGNASGEALVYNEVRGTEGVKEATYTVGGLTLKVAVCSGLVNAKKVLRAVKEGKADYHFIEVMACPGGCVNGGGQPIQPASVRNFVDLKALRAKALYSTDEKMALRKSHDNPAIQKLYAEFLEKPGSHVAHEVLHTSYVARPKY